jgi:hypothetical protein
MILIFFSKKSVTNIFFTPNKYFEEFSTLLLLQKIFVGASAFAQATLSQTASSTFFKFSYNIEGATEKVNKFGAAVS